MKATRRPRRSATSAMRVGVARAPVLPAEALGPVARELVGQLWESEQRHRMAFEHSPAGLACATLDGRFVSANEAWCALMDCSREQVSLSDLAAPEEFERHARLRRELLTGRIPSYSLATRRFRENGALWLQFDVCLCRGADDEPLYLLSSVHDISPMKHLEQRQALAQAGYAVERAALEQTIDDLHSQVASLTAANEAIERFLSLASHELLTPVTIVRAATQLLAKRLRRRAHRAPTGEIREAQRGSGLTANLAGHLDGDLELLGRIEAQAHALSRALADMAHTSRVGAERLDLCAEQLDLCALVREVVADQRLAHADRVILLEEAACEPDGAVSVMWDGDRIRQVVSNYLTNALKYSPHEAPVRVGVSVERGEAESTDDNKAVEQTEWKVARVAVRDEGVGIPPGEQPRVWECFYRVPGVRAQTRAGANLGLGLHICKSIVEHHGGEVGLSSTPGAGSTFWFSLPLVSGLSLQAVPKPPAEYSCSELL